ncbi:hypothetical protein ASF71_20885 [Deinococcus sp. Leaf326]|nr:hypothetical protein ASF71_20885 [Deinococcus sp. Leaf326]
MIPTGSLRPSTSLLRRGVADYAVTSLTLGLAELLICRAEQVCELSATALTDTGPNLRKNPFQLGLRIV